MIDDEADFGNITDLHGEVQAAAKFRPKVRAKPRKSSMPIRSLAPNPTLETTNKKVGAFGQNNLYQEVTINQENTSSTFVSNETVGDATACGGILDTPSDDAPIVAAVDMTFQNEDHTNDTSEIATYHENLVVADTQASSTHSSCKTIDDLAHFGEPFDTNVEDERLAKFKPKIQAKLSKAASKSQKINQKVIFLTLDAVSPNKEDCNNKTGCNDEQVHAPRHQECVQTSDSQASLRTNSSAAGNLANIDNISEEAVKVETIAKFRPKSRRKPGIASSRVIGTSDNSSAATLKVGIFGIDVVSQDNDGGRHDSGLCQNSRDEEAVTVPDTLPPQDIGANVDLDSEDELINLHTDGTRPIFGEPSAEATAKFKSNVGRKMGKGKSVSFVLPDASEDADSRDTDSEICKITHSCDDLGTDENLNNSQQQKSQKKHSDGESQYHVGEPPDTAFEEQRGLDVGKQQLSMKLLSRKKFQKIGIPEHTADDNFDEDSVEPSAAEEDNDSGNEYIAGGKQKRESGEKDINKKPSRGSKRTSIDSSVESQQQNLKKNRSEISSWGHKGALKDALAEQPEKKLTHRIRQKRSKFSEIKTLLEKPDHEIDRMKLSVVHLRLLQEARERIKSKTIQTGQSSNQSSQFGDMDNFDIFGENYDNGRTENHMLENATKLNYHSYMNRETRAKWSKSDTDLFYQGLQQFGSDFAMIQQLFPDKTRNQVRQKFKSEEKKHPMQVHDAILHRSRDNLYLKQVIKQLNIEDLQRDVNNTPKQEGASNKGDPGNENTLDDFTNEEENGSNWSDKEQGRSEVTEGEHVSDNADDDLDVFDWY